MNFNQKSHDLARFCDMLWCAAGRNPREYCDMAIEFGNSPHSLVEVNELIADSASHNYGYGTQTAYLDMEMHTRNLCSTADHGVRLLNGLLSLLGESSTVVTHNGGAWRL